MKSIFSLEIVLLCSLNQIIFCQLDKHDIEFNNFKEIALGNNRFAFKLLHFLGSQNNKENAFFSPTSLSTALGMVFLGARNESAAQIADVFNWSNLKREQVYSAIKIFRQTILSHQREFELNLANRVWGHQNLHVQKKFVTAMREIFDSDLTLKNFERDSDEIRNEVNQWVDQQTNGKIKDFLPPGSINPGTLLVLVNAVYFRGLWKYKFNEQNTFRAPFYAFGSREHEEVVEMMSMTAKFKYFHDERQGCRIIQLPYSGDKVSMMLLLPEEIDGLTKFESSLTVENLQRWTSLLANTTVSVAIPKFTLNQQIDLKTVLPELGLRDIFHSEKANLSGISENDGLFVSKAIHKAYVEVNERGTEAAAATGIVMMKRSLDMNEIFHADHPFIFLIRHHPSDSVLFVGRVVENIGQTNKHERPGDEL